MSFIRRQLKDIFTTGEGQYINEHGEEVYGKLPRSELENPLKILMKPTATSEFGTFRDMFFVYRNRRELRI